jgi:hypothetical protein
MGLGMSRAVTRYFCGHLTVFATNYGWQHDVLVPTTGSDANLRSENLFVATITALLARLPSGGGTQHIPNSDVGGQVPSAKSISRDTPLWLLTRQLVVNIYSRRPNTD